MTRLDAVNEQSRMFPTIELTQICALLRAGVSGASSPWQELRVRDTVKMLKNRLATWKDGLEVNKRYDDAVKQMIIAVIDEVKYYME